MSKEALSSFFKMVAENENLQHKLIEFAASQGFEFTADELSDKDLDGVAGGLSAEITAGKVNKSGSLFPDVSNTPSTGSSTPIPFPDPGMSEEPSDPTSGTGGSTTGGSTSPSGTSR